MSDPPSPRPARWFPATLWDLIRPGSSARVRASKSEAIAVAPDPPAAGTPPVRSEGPARPARSNGMKARYEELVVDMKRRYGIRVVRWRSSTSGCAWQVHYKDGSMARLIESPHPRGPMSCAVFLHEIGHHAIGFGTYRPRCLEEYHAWRWSFETMIVLNLNLTEAVRRRRDEALHYAIQKAARRGLKRLPAELVPFLEPRSRDLTPLPALLEEPRGPFLASTGSGPGDAADRVSQTV